MILSCMFLFKKKERKKKTKKPVSFANLFFSLSFRKSDRKFWKSQDSCRNTSSHLSTVVCSLKHSLAIIQNTK